LRLELLRDDGVHGVLVAAQDVDHGPGPDVPDPHGRVPAPAEDDVQRGVDRDGVDAAQVPVVLADALVLLQVPAPHALSLTPQNYLILAAREQVGVVWRDANAPYRADVSGER
jgi:hypothetical protein